MKNLTEKRVKEQLDKKGVQMDVTEKRVKEELNKEGGPNGHDGEAT